MAKSPLAFLGGPKAIKVDPKDIFAWPIITHEDRKAVLDVLNRGAMSQLGETKQFEKEFAAWQGTTYALAHSTGTASIEGALFGCKVGRGDEVICPSLTYWASALPAYNLGATVVFAEVDPFTLCLDPKDIERRITRRTKVILVVHYCGHPADMDPIMKIARKHKLKVIEDVSHAQGGLYKGRKLGAMGHVGAMSLMTEKSLPIGEGGMLVTNDTEIYERAIAWGHYERFGYEGPLKTKYLQPWSGLPLGGHKYRMHQMSSAVGRVQLKHYDKRCVEIRKAFNYFWDLLEGVPGVRAHRVDETAGSNMAGWYAPHGLYVPEELGGLSVTRFCQALQAEGAPAFRPGMNMPLHLHPIFNTMDIYGDGKPTRVAFARRDLRQKPGSLPVTEAANERAFHIPSFKRYYPGIIREHAHAVRKVAAHCRQLLPGDTGNTKELGGWFFARHR